MNRIKMLACLLFLYLVTICTAGPYYLAPNGVDTENGGSVNQPWKTISYATERMGARDTLYVAGGMYTEEKIIVKKGGSVTAPMVIKARGNGTPVFDLDYIKPVSTLPKAGPADTLRLPQGQSARSGSEDWSRALFVGVDNVVIDGLTLQGGAIGIWAKDFNGVTRTNLTIRNCTIRYHEQYAINLDKFDNVLIENCDVYHCGLINWPRGTNGWPHAIIGWRSKNVVVTKSRIHDNHGEGVGPFEGCSFWEIRNCEVWDNWSVNIYIDIDETDAIVDGNLSYYTGRYGTDGRNVPDAIRIANEIADMDYSYYGTQLDPSPAVPNVVVTNNICINTGGGINAFSYDLHRFYLVKSIIANNTIVGVSSPGTGIWIKGDSVVVANNLIVNCGIPTRFDTIGSGINNNNNLITNNAEFVAGQGFLAENYKIKQSSAAVNAGVSISAVKADFWGTPRPQGTVFDVGAHEYSVPVAVTSGKTSIVLKQKNSLSYMADLLGRPLKEKDHVMRSGEVILTWSSSGKPIVQYRMK